MNTTSSAAAAKANPGNPVHAIRKINPHAPLFTVTGRSSLVVAGGFALGDGLHSFAEGTPVEIAYNPAPGDDLVVLASSGSLVAHRVGAAPADGVIVVGGFHFAPGGNAIGTSGGDDVPAINPYSCWDLNWRPACADTSGMALIDGKFWCDIYLTGCDHPSDGTSRFGAFIADGDDTPKKIDDGVYAEFDFETAKAVLAAHGKQLLGAEEFFAAAYGVTERSAAGTDPKVAGLDALRTSRHGIMQATGNMLTWGTDGHPDTPRAFLFGGSWLVGSSAGSRCARLVGWPVISVGFVGARGRSDHLILA